MFTLNTKFLSLAGPYKYLIYSRCNNILTVSHYIVFNNDEWSAGFALDSNGISWSYQRLYQLYKQMTEVTEPNKEQDVQYPSKKLQHPLLHDLQVSQHTIKSLQEALLVAEQREQGMYKM